MTKTFVCDICSTELGTVDIEKLSIPMTPDMFQSLDSDAGIPVPFLPFQDFLSFKCRQCHNRPFKDPDHVTCLTDRGFHVRYDINKVGIEDKNRADNQAKINEIFGEEHVERPTPVSTYQDSIIDYFKAKLLATDPIQTGFTCSCGKNYKHQSSLARHQAVCNG